MESSHELLKKRVENILDMAVSTVSSLTESFSSESPLQPEEMKSRNEDFGTAEKMEQVEESVEKEGVIKQKTGAGELEGDEESVLTEVSDGAGSP